MDDNADDVGQKPRAFYWACAATVLYVVVLPTLFYFYMVRTFDFEQPVVSVQAGSIMMILALFFPLAIPYSIFAIWFNYHRAAYKRLRLYSLLPGIVLCSFVVFYYAAALAGHLFMWLFYSVPEPPT